MISTDAIITTPRLLLRKPTVEDAHAMQSAKEACWPELQKWMSWSSDERKPLSATLEFINADDGQYIQYCAFHRVSGAFLIATGIGLQDPDAGLYSTGYWANPNFLNQGFATEATNAIIRFAFAHNNVKKMHICHYEGNDASKRIIEKLGFDYTDTEEKSHARHSDGKYLDTHNYLMTSSQNLPELDVSWTKGPTQS